MTQTDRERAFECQQVEQVFGLAGGELENKPWTHWTRSEHSDGTPMWGEKLDGEHADMSFHQWDERYWYEGVPDYDERANAHDYDSVYRTVVNPGGMLMAPRQELYDGQGIWKLVEVFNNSGEAPCPFREWDPINRAEASDQAKPRIVQQQEADLNDGIECGLCGEYVGIAHGYIYLGVCCYEAVYKLEEQGGRPVALVDEQAEGGPTVIARFETLAEAEQYVETLPGVELGRYGIDAPEEMVNGSIDDDDEDDDGE